MKERILMAYCDKCGAYIPDGQTSCLACGKSTVEGAAAYDYAEDNARSRAEERRAKKQEENHRWAEDEFKRRQSESEKQAESYVNRPSESQARTTSSRTQQPGSSADRTTSSRVGKSVPRSSDFKFDTGVKDNRLFAVLSYISVLFLLPFFVDGSDDFAKYHAKQGARLFIASLIAEFALGIIGLPFIAVLARLGLMAIGIINALQGKRAPLPYIGTFKF